MKRIYKISPYILFFLFSIFLTYLPDLSPHYLSLFAHQQVKVIGPLTRFEEACIEPQSEDWVCRVQYRVPRSLIGEAEAIGFGIILFSTEVICAGDPTRRVTLEPREEDGGRISSYLRTYQTLSLDRLPCDSDLLVRNWSKKLFYRHGYSQAPLTIGSQQWIEGIKTLVEFSTVGLSVASAFTFFIFYLMLGALQRITQTAVSFPPFEPFRFFWLGFIVLSSGFLFEFIFPIHFSFPFVSKLTNFFGLLAVSGPTALFIATEKNAFPVLRKSASFLVSSPRYQLWPLILLVLSIMVTPYFRYIYPYAIAGLGMICIVAALRMKNLEVLLYGICEMSDGFKIFMVPGLPASRLTVTYMLFLFVYGMKRQINILEENARFEAGSAVALQIAHDIRAPVGALKSILPLMNGPDEVREVAVSALKRIQSVAGDLLQNSRSAMIDSGLLTREELVALTKDVVAQKRLELKNENIQIVESYINDFTYVSLNPAMYGRILSNILNNAVDALPALEGKIKVSVNLLGESASVSVVDNGSGIPPHILESIGRKGFSTKGEGLHSGTGIGLFNAKRALDQWNARLKINSIEKQFTEVVITFPISKRAPDVV